MFNWLRKARPQVNAESQAVRNMALGIARNLLAKYDAAQTTDDNSRHWSNADGLSAAAANCPDVRRKLRNRARYEYANNCFANGMVRTVAYHCIGTGPRIQVDTGSDESDAQIERAWQRWANSIRLADKLRTLRQAKCRDGEAFAMFITNKALAGQVKLDLRLIEADQIARFHLERIRDNSVDGIDFDESGNPVRYHLLKDHPGNTSLAALSMESEPIPAEMMIHLFRADRPGQVRGIPEITPALPLYAVLRRYTLATLHAAEVAAIFAVLLKTNGAVDAASVDPWETLAVERNAMTTLPAGWDMAQIKPEHPTQAYDAFQKSVIREIARCLSMPFGIAAGDSSSYNYSSFRADDQLWVNEIEIERDFWAVHCLDRIAEEWRKEAIAAKVIPDVPDLNHQWFWDERQSVDVEKEARAAIALRNAGLLTEADYFSALGWNWRQKMRQRKREHELREELGLPVNEELPAQPQDSSGNEQPSEEAA